MSAYAQGIKLLYANRDHALAAQKQAAASTDGTLLAVQFSTIDDLIQEAWEVYGDGRKLIDDAQRRMLMYTLLADHVFLASSSVAQLIAQFFSEYAYSLAHRSDDLILEESSEVRVLELFDAYQSSLVQLGLIERTCTFDVVTQFASFFEIRFGESWLLGGADRLLCETLLKLEPLPDEEAIELPDNLHVTVLRPFGSLAIDRMLLAEIQSLLDEYHAHSIALCAQDSYCRFNNLREALIRQGISLSFEGSLSIECSCMGKALRGATQLLKGCITEWRDIASDVAASVYVIPKDKRLSALAYGKKLNTQWRKDRTLNVTDAVDELRSSSCGAPLLFDIVEGIPEKSLAALEVLTAYARQAFSGFERARELAVLSALTDAVASISAMYPTEVVPTDLLLTGSVRVSYACAPQGAHAQTLPHIAFYSFEQMNRMGAEDYDAVIIDDVSDACLGALEQRKPLDRLVRKIEAHDRVSSSEKLRFGFRTAVRAAARELICVLPARNAGGDPLYPSFPFEELLSDVYGSSFDVKKITEARSAILFQGLTPPLKVICAGEENFEESIGKTFTTPEKILCLPEAKRGLFGHANLLSSLKTKETEGASIPLLSASAIETYLSCPYGWFLERRLQPCTLDEGFGPLERGNFAHLVLERMYAYMGCREQRLNAQSSEELRSVFDALFNEALKEQFTLPANSGRYVPITTVEDLETEQLRASLWQALLLEACLPSRFEQYGEEISIGFNADEGSTLYAGVAIRGRIDRVDRDPLTGQTCILDYKGSVRDHHAGSGDVDLRQEGEELVIDPMTLPDHVQALVYASLVRQHFLQNGEEVAMVGAAYTSYRVRDVQELLVGSISAACSDLAPFTDRKSLVQENMELFLDRIEEAIAKRMSPLFASLIPVMPTNGIACRSCPYSGCEMRR